MSREEQQAWANFCSNCFADDEGGSWGCGTDRSHCYNCGMGLPVSIPVEAVRNIRKQASWVGKRYYPHEEDIRELKELAYFRTRAGDPKNRTAEYRHGAWFVSQPSGEGKILSIVTQASSAEDALNKVRHLMPYPIEE